MTNCQIAEMGIDMRKAFFMMILVVCPTIVLAQSVAWNCMHLASPYYSIVENRTNYELYLETYLSDSTGFDAYVILCVADAVSDISITTRDLEDTASGFIGNWVVGNKGDVANEATTRHLGNYLNHAKIDGETAYTTYDI